MKTFEEALGSICITVPMEEVTPQLQAEILARVADRVQRVRGLLDEAASNQHLEKVMESYLQVSQCLHCAMLNAFHLGLEVGMEMEKSEAGALAP